MTVHSTDRTTRSTKLERLGELATTNKDTVFNNLGHIINYKLLIETFHQLEGNKAAGIDGINKEMYGKRLHENINDLIGRIRKGTYKPKPSRLSEIPKDDGSKRPLAVACFEDKIVQAAVSKILTILYEPLFLPCSFGFRPNHNCHDALRALMKHTYPCWEGAIVEIDIRQYFNSIPHDELRKILEKKISDKRFLRLIDKLATAPTYKEGSISPNIVGCPQGSILSPILANIYLHEVIDVWFNELKQQYFKYTVEEVRYADDMVFVFQSFEEAKRFFDVLPKRLKKFGLDMHTEKSRLIRSGQNVAKRENNFGRRLPTYQFLGFTVYWGKARNGKWWRLKFTSRRDRFTKKLNGLKEFLMKHLNTTDTIGVLKLVAKVVAGWVNYHAISDNEKRVNQFIRISRQMVRKWINRKGRKRPMNWENFNKLLKKINFPGKFKTTSLFSAR